METSNIPVEENAASGSLESIVPINSKSTDLQLPMENVEITKCQHNFSILGYAAQMRLKNPKNSNPFSSNIEGSDFVEKLPPLSVPRFRWWSCPECRRKIGTNSSTSVCMCSDDGTAMVTQSDPSAIPSHEGPKFSDTVDVAVTGAVIERVDPVEDKSANVGDEGTISQIGHKICTGDKKECTEQVTNTADVEVPEDLRKSADGCSFGVPPEEKNKSTDGVGVAPQGVEGGNASSETESDNSQHGTSCLSRRRVKKVRLMTELLGDKANFAAYTGPQDRALCADVGMGTRGPQRKMLQHEGEMTSQGIVPREVSTGEEDSERTMTDDGLLGLEDQATASSRVDLQIGSRTDRMNCRIEKSAALPKMKNKQFEQNKGFSANQGKNNSGHGLLKKKDIGFSKNSTSPAIETDQIRKKRKY